MKMPWPPNLTERAREVFARAHDLADRRGDADLTPAHLALGLLEEGQNVAVYVLSARGVPLDALARELTAALPAAGTPRAAPSVRRLTPDDEEFVARAEREARDLDTPYYGAEHLLLALLRDCAGVPAQLLARHGVGFEDARANVRRVLLPPSDASATPPAG
ncbi:MAG: Clp protease N-terminal domain-containing protein [Gemmatimonadaceae bacterium]|nr:Clp protease N-terminal domain-containing protein [Gemmatimonadaceae bacterium]